MLVDQKTGNVLSGIPYLIHRENGEIEEGITDENGYKKIYRIVKELKI